MPILQMDRQDACKQTGRMPILQGLPLLSPLSSLQNTLKVKTNPSIKPMSDPTLETPTVDPAAPPAEPPPSYVKLAMRNMVRKGGKSLFHFALTVTGLLALLVGLSYLTR
jgi:hypothetical protein